MKNNIKFYYPAGNETALVLGDGGEFYSGDFKALNDEILSSFSGVEQVGFLKDVELKMAGGEICFNALRCAGKYFLDKFGVDKIDVILNDKSYECGVKSPFFIKKHDESLYQKYKNDDMIYLKAPLEYDFKTINENEFLCDLKDIVHVIYTKKIGFADENELKNYAYEYLKNANLLDRKAAGFMYLDDDNLHPVVWVKDIKTLFYESACGSGSFASFVYKKEILAQTFVALKQPSSEYLFLEKDDDFVIISSFIKELDKR